MWLQLIGFGLPFGHMSGIDGMRLRQLGRQAFDWLSGLVLVLFVIGTVIFVAAIRLGVPAQSRDRFLTGDYAVLSFGIVSLFLAAFVGMLIGLPFGAFNARLMRHRAV